MTAKPKDTFFNNYAFGTIESPDKIDIKELLVWFHDNNIIAGVAAIDRTSFEFYVPMIEDLEPYRRLIGVVTPDGELDFKLLPAQLSLDLAKKFSASVIIGEDMEDFADWTHESKAELPPNTADYIVSKAPSESAMVYAYTIKRAVEYARLNNVSLWRTKSHDTWHDHSFMPRELPAFIFGYDYLQIQYKTLRDPAHFDRTHRIEMSYNDTDVYNLAWQGTRAETAMNEISDSQLRPGSDIDSLVRAGVLKKSRAEQLLDTLSGDQKDFVTGICKVFDLPEEIAQHITAGTMPENSQTAKVSGWLKLMSRTVEEYAYEPDPHAGPVKRLYAYISVRPLLDWAWMIGELTTGIVMAYYFLISQLDVSQPWWHYLLGMVGVFGIFESLIGMYLTVKRRLS